VYTYPGVSIVRAPASLMGSRKLGRARLDQWADGSNAKSAVHRRNLPPVFGERRATISIPVLSNHYTTGASMTPVNRISNPDVMLTKQTFSEPKCMRNGVEHVTTNLDCTLSATRAGADCRTDWTACYGPVQSTLFGGLP
jgi:hypothetical protein